MKLNLIAVLGLIVGSVTAHRPDSAWIAARYTKQEVMVPMRDGAKLFTTIYAPKDASEKHPVLMMRTPYSVAPYGKDRFSPRLYTTHWIRYVNMNYIIVMQDVRGCYMSEGEFMDVRPFNPKPEAGETDEATDAYDAIDWIVKNVDGNNGNVGVFGISYPGFYATMAAASKHPALKAVSPQAPVTDWFLGDDFHHNGAFALMDGFSFYYSFGRPRPVPVQTRGRRFSFPLKDAYTFHLRQGFLKNYGALMNDSVAFWKELMAHPDLDNWWRERDARRAAVNLKPAMLIVGGNFDAEDCYGAWNLYKAIERKSPGADNRLVMGPWYHGGWHRGEGSYLGQVRFGAATSTFYQDSLEVPFFEFHLRGKGTVKPIAEATIFFSGENAWRRFNSWPPSNLENRKIFFHENSALKFTAPDKTGSLTSYVSDPAKPVPYADGIHLQRTREYMIDDQRFAARRPDVLVFETPILDEDLTVAGPVTADLKVSLTGTDADFVVKIIDVFPDSFKYDSAFCCKGNQPPADMGGYQMLVRGEIMRGKYRRSFEKPEPFKPGTVETVAFTLPDVAHTFKKGHRLMIQVQSSWFPLFDRNPQKFVNIYTCDEKDFARCEIKLHHGAGAASSITLPVLKSK